jgi:hypothetical protein
MAFDDYFDDQQNVSPALRPMYFKKNPFAPDFSEPAPPNIGSGVPGSGNISSALMPASPGPSLQGTQEYQDFNDVGSRLRQALQPNQVSMPRALIGALLSRRNPMLGSVITGDYQRQKQIQPLEAQYDLLSKQIANNRAMQMQDLNMKNIGSEITERGRTNDIRQQIADTKETPPPKGLPEQDVAYLQTQTNPDTGKPYTLHEAYAKSLETVSDNKADTKGGQLTDLDIGGQNHKVLVDTKSGAVIRDLGRSKLPVPPAAAAEHDLEPVMAYDKAGRAHIIPKAEATAPGSGYTNIIKASDKDLNDAKTHAVVLNDMQSKLNDVISSADALDQGNTQRAIISSVLSHSEPGMVNDTMKRVALSGASEKTKEYIQSVLSLKESGLGLPKELTGGSRTSDIQSSALFQTLPSGSSANSKYALSQAKKFQANLDRLRQRVPGVRGMEEVAPHPAITGAAPTYTRQGGNVVVEQ